MNTFDFIKGVGVGIIAGSAMSVALTANSRRMKKSKHPAVRSIGEAVDSVSDLLHF